MNPYFIETVCAICGGKGMCTLQTQDAEWSGSLVTHRNPRACIDELRRKQSHAQEQP